MAVRCPPRLVQGTLHKFLREIAFRISWATVVNAVFVFVTLVAGTAFTIVTAPEKYTEIGWAVLAFLVVLAIVQAITMYRSSRNLATLRVDLLSSCLVLMHENVFNNDEDFRFSLFIKDPLAKVRASSSPDEFQEIFVPYVRRWSGESEYTARRSKVYFPRNSQAGAIRSWNSAVSVRDRLQRGEFDFSTTKLPDFSSREAMNAYFINELSIEPEVVHRMSSHMSEVVQIWTFPLVNDEGLPMALLSVDSKKYFTMSPTSSESASGEVIIDQEKLTVQLEAMRNLTMKVGLPNQHKN